MSYDGSVMPGFGNGGGLERAGLYVAAKLPNFTEEHAVGRDISAQLDDAERRAAEFKAWTQTLEPGPRRSELEKWLAAVIAGYERAREEVGTGALARARGAERAAGGDLRPPPS
jgi:hypothetical protein